MPVVSTTVWILTAIFIIALLAFDFIFHVRKAHIPTIGEAAKWTAIYVSVAILFGVWCGSRWARSRASSTTRVTSPS